MKLDNYFKQRPKGRAKTAGAGKATAWMDFCEFRLRGPKFLIVDAGFLPSHEDGLLVKAPAGEYQLQAQVMAYGKDRRISRLRAFLKGAEGKPGKKLGETWTDTATTALCDFRVFSDAWGDDDEASYAKIEEALDPADSHGIACLDAEKKAIAPLVSSGFGDGTYPVFALEQNGKRVGFEIEFIAAGTPYPFGKSPARTPKTSPVTGSDQSQDLMPQLMDRLGKALQQGKKSPSLTPEQKKANLMAAFKGIEDELRGTAEQAAAEYRLHIQEVRRKASPPRLNFVPVPDAAMFEASEALRRTEELRAAGFVAAGNYQTDGVARGKIAGFVHQELRLYATVNSSAEGTDCDIYAEYADQTSFCVTENTRNAWLLGPPWRTMLRKPVRSIGQLLKFLLQKAPRKERLPATAEEFVRRLVPDASRYLDWFNDRGGVSEVEIKALAQQKKNPRAEDREWLRERRIESADRALFNWLRIQPGLPFQPEAVTESLIIVHDGLTPELLVVPYWCATGDYKARESDFAEGAAREAFSRVNAQRGSKLRKVAEKSTGLAADYYLPAA